MKFHLKLKKLGVETSEVHRQWVEVLCPVQANKLQAPRVAPFAGNAKSCHGA